MTDRAPPPAAGDLDAAIAHHQAGRLAEAEAIYQRILLAAPGDVDALHLLGLVALGKGEASNAVTFIEKAIALNPGVAPFHNSLGNALKVQGDLEGAIKRFREALDLDPTLAGVHVNLGNTLWAQGNLEAAEQEYRAVPARSPQHFEALKKLGALLKALDRPNEAPAAFREALEINGDDAEIHNSLGATLLHLGEIKDAKRHLREAIAIDPGFAEAYNNLGGALKNQGNAADAVEIARSAVRLKPNDALLHSNLLCMFDYVSNPDQAMVLAEHHRWAEQHAGRLPKRQKPYQNDADPDRRLRIGYVSPDFYRHSVAYFIEPLLAAHCQSEFEVYCYANVAKPDDYTARLRELAAHWRDINGMDDEEVANLVRQDRIDILVDLTGHFARNRLVVFARKPAPIQVSYLGYRNTTGLDAIDYRLTDGLADPKDQDQFYSEKLIRLPRCFLCYKPPANAPPVQPSDAHEKGYITFGSFNNVAKLTPDVMAVWSEILNATPNSRLFLKSAAFKDEETRIHFSKMLANKNVGPDRIEFGEHTKSQLDHLALYNKIDIALDPFPYTGATSTCDALWMGVPVVTLAGKVHNGRVGVSLLSALGLEELIGKSPHDYVTIASGLANDPDHLASLQSGLRDRMAKSPLCDSTGFAREIENVYRTIWKQWCQRANHS